jgi:monovalent cation/hydrogen antiporter
VEDVEVVLVLLLVAVVVLSAAARAIAVPYPIVLVIGGALLGLSGGLPRIELDPDLVLVIFLPPLLYTGAFFANLNDLRRNLRPILLSSVVLVLATVVVVAAVAHRPHPGHQLAGRVHARRDRRPDRPRGRDGDRAPARGAETDGLGP